MLERGLHLKSEQPNATSAAAASGAANVARKATSQKLQLSAFRSAAGEEIWEEIGSLRLRILLFCRFLRSFFEC